MERRISVLCSILMFFSIIHGKKVRQTQLFDKSPEHSYVDEEYETVEFEDEDNLISNDDIEDQEQLERATVNRFIYKPHAKNKTDHKTTTEDVETEEYETVKPEPFRLNNKNARKTKTTPKDEEEEVEYEDSDVSTTTEESKVEFQSSIASKYFLSSVQSHLNFLKSPATEFEYESIRNKLLNLGDRNNKPNHKRTKHLEPVTSDEDYVTKHVKSIKNRNYNDKKTTMDLTVNLDTAIGSDDIKVPHPFIQNDNNKNVNNKNNYNKRLSEETESDDENDEIEQNGNLPRDLVHNTHNDLVRFSDLNKFDKEFSQYSIENMYQEKIDRKRSNGSSIYRGRKKDAKNTRKKGINKKSKVIDYTLGSESIFPERKNVSRRRGNKRRGSKRRSSSKTTKSRKNGSTCLSSHKTSTTPLTTRLTTKSDKEDDNHHGNKHKDSKDDAIYNRRMRKEYRNGFLV